MTAALGHGVDPLQPLLRARRSDAVIDEAGATALGVAVAADLRAAGAGSYLPAA